MFTSERGVPFDTAGFARMVERAAVSTRTCLGTPAAMRWPTEDTIRERCKPTSGHKNIQHTVRYTELSLTRFKNFWRE